MKERLNNKPADPKKTTPETEGVKNPEQKPAINPVIADCLSPENKNFYSKMSDRGKTLMGKIYEGIYRIPGVNRVVGKLEIAYDQSRMDRHSKKASDLKNKMDGLDLEISSLDGRKTEIASFIEQQKTSVDPSFQRELAKLQLESTKLGQQKNGLLSKKEGIRSRFDSQDNTTKLFTNRRDAIADKLINRYNEKLVPMEKELEQLHTQQKELNFLIAITDAKDNQLLKALDDEEKEKSEKEDALRGFGRTEKQIKIAVRDIDLRIAKCRKQIMTQREAITQRKDEINSKIAKTDAKANPYRDKREEFIRIKSGRPLIIKVEDRERAKEFKGEEKIVAHSVEERSETVETPLKETTKPETKAETKPETKAETKKEDKETIEVSSLISDWNEYFKKKSGEKSPIEPIDLEDFLKKAKKPLLSGDTKLGFKDYKEILRGYYDCKNVSKASMDKFGEIIDEFIDTEKKKKNPENGEEPAKRSPKPDETSKNPTIETSTGATEKNKEQLKASTFVSAWNKYLREEYSSMKDPNKLVKLNEFLKGASISKDQEISLEDFREKLKAYYRPFNVDMTKLDEDIDKCFQNLKTKK
ncbi:MAG: hypothetical protein NTW73_01745 [Candidatus Parcubacteria bacterium]|nr:hypothetical protein [Candidatus Parcubacteria bacterium]